MTKQWDPNIMQYRDAGKFAGNDETAAAGGLNALVTRRSWRDLEFKAWEDQETGDENYYLRQRTKKPNAAFNERVRMLVGAPKRAKVTVSEEFSEVNPWGCDTWESSESIDVTVGETTHTYSGLPELLSRLEYADRERDLEVLRDKHLGAIGTFHCLGHDGQVVSLRGRFGNANNWTLVVLVPADSNAHRKIRRWDSDRPQDGELLVRVNASSVLAFDVDDTVFHCQYCNTDKAVEHQYADDRELCKPCSPLLICPSCSKAGFKLLKEGETCFDCWLATHQATQAKLDARCQDCYEDEGHADWCVTQES